MQLASGYSVCPQFFRQRIAAEFGKTGIRFARPFTGRWKAMSGLPHAAIDRGMPRSYGVSLPGFWLSHLRKNNERPSQCSIFIVLSSSGEGASSS
jgi:hypothetical protein